MGWAAGGWQDQYQGLCDRLDALTAALNDFPRSDQQHAQDYREWNRFELIDGGLTSGGALTVGGGGTTGLRPCPTGWEAYLTSIAVTVTGASAAATVTAYNGELSDINLMDYANQMFGNSPSRLVSFYDPETVWVNPGDPVVIVIAAAATGGQNVTVRICGKRRQL